MDDGEGTGSRGAAPRVFLSYSHADRRFVSQLDSALLLSGVGVFLDERDIKGGDVLPDVIHDAIQTCDALISVLSAASASSAWMREELAAAKTRAVTDPSFRVIPLVIEDGVEVPPSLRHIAWLDFTRWGHRATFGASLERLLVSLGASVPTQSLELRAWVLQHAGRLIDYHAALAFADGHCNAGTLGAFHLSALGGATQERFIDWVVAKMYLEDPEPGLLPLSKALDEACQEAAADEVGEVAALRTAAANVAEAATRMRAGYRKEDVEAIYGFWRLARTAQAMVGELLVRAVDPFAPTMSGALPDDGDDGRS